MYRYKLMMDWICYDFCLFACRSSPKQENYRCSFAVKLGNYAVGKGFPTHTLMAVCVVFTNSKYGMEGDLIAGANIAGFEKVADAMIAQGVAY